MVKVYISEILKKEIGEKVRLKGWVHRKRVHGKIVFIDIRDKTGIIQATFKKDILKEKFEKVKEISEESVIEVYGTINKKKKEGKEILVEDFKILNISSPLPIEIWNPEIKTEFIKRVKYRFLDLRKKEIQNIFIIRNKVIQAFREYLLNNGFIEMQTPKIVLMGVESGAETFEINYYNKTAYLSQSPQLYKQMLMASGIDKYFEFGWYWRAEKFHTSRHLSEFYSLDVEIAWIDSYLEIFDLLEDMIKFVLRKIKKECKEELETLNVEVEIPKKIPRITLREAYKILEKEFGKHLEYGSDLDTDSEKFLGEYFYKEYNEPFVFVLEYPWKEKPFYVMRKEDEPEWVYYGDCLYKGLEIVSGGQREHRYEILIKQAKEKKVPLEPLKYYLEAFRLGMPPHGGFGLGIDRFVKQLLNLKDIRESVLWFRDPEHLLP